MVIFTSICTNYIHKARTLAESVKTKIPDATFVVCLVEREVSAHAVSPCFDRIVLAKDAWDGNFDRFIFKHSIVEASTAVKGQFFRYLYEAFPEEDQFVYLDPDTYVYSDFIELRSLLRERPILLCPHLLKPGNIDMELSSTAHGVYNLGFLAVNRSDEARRFINWWAERLYLYCYDDILKGVFTDQKWIDLAPCFFNTTVFKHRGYDFATWSLLNCEMEEKDGDVFVEGDPLRFIHYSGYGSVLNNCIEQWLPKGEDHPFKKLHAAYSQLHDANDRDGISKTNWTYAAYNSGERIDDKIRAKYRSDYDLMFSIENPFALSNHYFKRELNNGIAQKIGRTLAKMKHIIKTQGFSVLIKKIVKKLFH